MTPGMIVDKLGMQAHPEGGWYVETFRDSNEVAGRAAMTAIYFLLEAGQKSHWHKVDATEVWLWHQGSPLQLSISEDAETARMVTLGPDLTAGQVPQGIVPKDAWQSAEPINGWTLVSCIVAPGFEFEHFQLAASNWKPGSDR